MLPFSIVSISKNNAGLISQYCDSIEKHFGKINDQIEVILVDTGSSDDTIKLAQDRGIKVTIVGNKFDKFITKKQSQYINKHCGENIVYANQEFFDFAQARNFADLLAINDWCLSLDICDFIENVNLDELLQSIKYANENPNIHSFEYIFNFCGYAQTCNKFYHRAKGNWRCVVHEIKYREANFITHPLKNDVLQIKRDLVNNNSYLVGLAYAYYFEKDFDTNKRIRYYLGRDLYYAKKYIAAEKILKNCSGDKNEWSKQKAFAFFYLGNIYYDQNKIIEAIKAYVNSIATYPNICEPYLKLAKIKFDENDFIGAIGYCDQSLLIEADTENLLTTSLSDNKNYITESYKIKYLSLIKLSQIYRNAKITDLRWIEKALELEDKTGLSNDLKYQGWQEYYTAIYHTNYDISKQYFIKCKKLDSKRCEHDKKYYLK